MKNFKTFYENTIINNIDLNAYDLNDDIDLFDKVQNTYNIFKSEYVHSNNKHLNETYLFKEWLQGLPNILTVPFYNSDILKNGLNFAIETNDKLLRKKVRNEEQFLNNYWENLANAFFTLKNNL